MCSQVKCRYSQLSALFLVLFINEHFQVFDGAFLGDFLHYVCACQVISRLLLHGRLGVLGDGGKFLNGLFLDLDTEIIAIFVFGCVQVNPITQDLTVNA